MEINAEMTAISESYVQAAGSGRVETQPRLDYAPYRSSLLRHPTKDLVHADPETIEQFAPVFGHRDVAHVEADLTVQDGGEPVGERIVVTGRVLDGDGRPVRHQLVEVWQAIPMWGVQPEYLDTFCPHDQITKPNRAVDPLDPRP